MPKRGEQLTIDNLNFKVLRADSRRLHLLLVEKKARRKIKAGVSPVPKPRAVPRPSIDTGGARRRGYRAGFCAVLSLSAADRHARAAGPAVAARRQPSPCRASSASLSASAVFLPA